MSLFFVYTIIFCEAFLKASHHDKAEGKLDFVDISHKVISSTLKQNRSLEILRLFCMLYKNDALILEIEET